MPTLESKIESHEKKIAVLEEELTTEGKDIEKAMAKQRKKSQQYHKLLAERDALVKLTRMSDDERNALAQVSDLIGVESGEEVGKAGG